MCYEFSSVICPLKATNSDWRSHAPLSVRLIKSRILGPFHALFTHHVLGNLELARSRNKDILDEANEMGTLSCLAEPTKFPELFKTRKRP